MGSSTCVITVLLLMVIFLQTVFWKVLASVMRKTMQVGNNSQAGFRGRGFLDHLSYTCFFRDEYKLRKKKEICLEL
jgi:hypothetical protein